MSLIPLEKYREIYYRYAVEKSGLTEKNRHIVRFETMNVNAYLSLEYLLLKLSKRDENCAPCIRLSFRLSFDLVGKESLIWHQRRPRATFSYDIVVNLPWVLLSFILRFRSWIEWASHMKCMKILDTRKVRYNRNNNAKDDFVKSSYPTKMGLFCW